MANQFSYRIKALFILLPLACTAIADQALKALARASLYHSNKSYLFGILQLELTFNSGAFLGLGAKLSPQLRFWIFTILPLLIVFIIWWHTIFSNISRLLAVSWSFIAAGVLSNCIDRFLFNGPITDFVLISIGPLHTGVFNLADALVLFGAIVITVNISTIYIKPCPNCSKKVRQKWRHHTSLLQYFQGGYTCPHCGKSITIYGFIASS